MDLGLKNKVVLITGGSKGIGLACARLFVADGAKVIICSRSQSNLDAALVQLPGAIGLAADLTSEQQALEMVNRIERDIGAINVLVNCAGAAKRSAVEELTPQLWRKAMDAKYFSYINTIDPVIKRMGSRHAGVIVNVIGSGGKVASTPHLAGGAANAALMLATVGLASAYAGQGVRVIGINPGLTETDRVTEALKVEAAITGHSSAIARSAMTSRIPLGRFAHPDEIAQVVMFLCSSKASYVTGIIMGMDGGQSATVV